MAPKYIAVGPTGNVKGSIAPDDPHIIFSGDPDVTIVMPTHTNAIAISPDGMKALVRGNNDRTYRVHRVPLEGVPQIEDVDSAVGTYDVGFHPLTGVEYWIHAISAYKVGGVEKPVPIDQTGDYISGQGWTQIFDSGLPAWTDQVGRKVLEGHSLTRCVTLGDWVIGMETDSRGWILLVNTQTHKTYIAWEEYTPIGPSFVLRNNQPVAGITFPGVEVTLFHALDGSGEIVGGGGTPVTPTLPNLNINLPGLPQWQIRVIATAIIYGPDPEDIPGIPPKPPTFQTPQQPGQPDPGSGAGVYGPNEMPNMKYILDQVLTTKSWKFTQGEEYDMRQSDGRGAFTAAAVQAMHDVDARFGHYLRKPGYSRYLPGGGSLDSVCFKNDDGTTQEGAVIVANTIQWVAKDRAPRVANDVLDSWVYPAVP
jgi:hypothetical protein